MTELNAEVAPIHPKAMLAILTEPEEWEVWLMADWVEARKHCGRSNKWQIGLPKLQEKTGSNAPIKRFRLNLREIIKNDVTPFYRFELDDNDLVSVRPRSPSVALTPEIIIPAWADEKAREHAHALGWDFHVLRSNWLDFARAKASAGEPPVNPGAAFVAYCRKQERQR